MRWPIEERPSWRGDESSSKMLVEVSEKLRDSIPEHKIQAAFIDFVHQSNLGEDVGTQIEEQTKEIFTRFKGEDMTVSKTKSLEQKESETLNTFKALQKVVGLHEEMEHTGMITVQQICDVHGILLKGLHENHGMIRETYAYTITPDGEKYYYAAPDMIESRLYNVVDQHNLHMQQLQKMNASHFEKLEFLVKCAAWFMFNFVDVHPFSDGNGRMCRLLAGYTMMVLTSMPVHPYHTRRQIDHSNETLDNSRQDYIEAIVSCRRTLKREPSILAALLVDGLYNGWCVNDKDLYMIL